MPRLPIRTLQPRRTSAIDSIREYVQKSIGMPTAMSSYVEMLRVCPQVYAFSPLFCSVFSPAWRLSCRMRVLHRSDAVDCDLWTNGVVHTLRWAVVSLLVCASIKRDLRSLCPPPFGCPLACRMTASGRRCRRESTGPRAKSSLRRSNWWPTPRSRRYVRREIGPFCKDRVVSWEPDAHASRH